MALADGYGNSIATKSQEARDHYERGVQVFLAADYGAAQAFGDAVAADPEFALGHAGLPGPS